MGRAPCCDKSKVKRGPWSPEEDMKLKEYIHRFGTGGNWIALPQKVGLKRCGKSCRLRWLNYLRPNIKHGDFSEDEDTIICTLFATIGSRWSIIAAQLPGRTDNDIKNYWNTKLKKKLLGVPASQRKSNLHMKQQQQNYHMKFEDQNTDNLLVFGGNAVLDQNDNYVISYAGLLPEDSQYYDLLGGSSNVNGEASMEMYAGYGGIEGPSSTNISFETQERAMYSYN